MNTVKTVCWLWFTFASFSGFAFQHLGLEETAELRGCGSIHLAIEKETDFITLQKDLSVAGDKICHDGVHVFFKNSKTCSEHNNLMAPLGIEPVSCIEKPLTALKSVEEITLASGDTVYRFFAVDIYYESRLRGVSETCTTESIPREHILDVCEPTSRPTQFTKTIWSQRAASQSETPFLRDLHASGLKVINSPEGIQDSVRFMNPVLWDLPSGRANPSNFIRSPNCNSEFQRYFQSVGGEFTGTSRAQLDLFLLQDYSSPLTKQTLSPGSLVKTSSTSVQCNPETDL